jgi:hypothetical protein
VRRLPSRVWRIPRTGGGLIGTLEDLLLGVAKEAGADAARSATGIEFQRGRKVFAAVSGDVAEFLLDPEIAEAALSTPSTSVSPRGGDWVRLAPGSPSPMDLDRARAWFLSAWRAAGG